MRKFLAVTVAALIISLFGYGVGYAVSNMGSTSSPPQCVETVVHENSNAGPNLWVKWCGTGSNAPSPMKSSVRNLTVDGGVLDKYCTRANPCVVLWP